MPRRTFFGSFVLFVSFVAVFVFSVAPGAQAPRAQNAAPSGLETLPVQGNVSMIAGAGGNIVVQFGAQGLVVVDSGTAARSDDVLAAIRKLSNRPIRYVINTHMHPDHTG